MEKKRFLGGNDEFKKYQKKKEKVGLMMSNSEKNSHLQTEHV